MVEQEVVKQHLLNPCSVDISNLIYNINQIHELFNELKK
jgi:hypothetical protein